MVAKNAAPLPLLDFCESALLSLPYPRPSLLLIISLCSLLPLLHYYIIILIL